MIPSYSGKVGLNYSRFDFSLGFLQQFSLSSLSLLALPCLIAIGCALPPDYSLPQKTDDEYYSKPNGSPDNPQYNPQPINTSNITLDNDLNSTVQKFSEHYHDAWASRKMEAGWTHDNSWSDSSKTHPRLKPYDMLNDYVSIALQVSHRTKCNETFISRNESDTKSPFVKV